nr:hypothetical protein [Bacteroides bouchesdurhonensis]
MTFTFANALPNKGSFITVPIFAVLAGCDAIPLFVSLSDAAFPDAEEDVDFFTGGMT